MSNLNKVETMEPSVIDEEMIKECMALGMKKPQYEQKDTGADGDEDDKAKEQEVVEFHEVETLIFSFQNIFRIENLVGFENLIKLQLDNNVIEKMENIEHLVNLQWLDLSFNNIEKIEGLETLTKLTDLSLFSNRIAKLENLDTLTELNVLSVGNNNLKDHENLKYLRQFKNLKLVNLAGNPLCKVPDPDYRTYVMAFVPTLKYLDYRLVDDAARQTARETYQEELLNLEEDEARDAALEEQQQQREKEVLRIKESNLEGVDSLFDDLLREDTEMTKFSTLSVVGPLLTDFRTKVAELLDPVREFILEQTETKKVAIVEFREVVEQTKRANEATALTKIGQFEKLKKQVVSEIKESDYANQSIVSSLKDSILSLNDDLMKIEVDQVDAFEAVILDFEKAYGELIQKNVEKFQQFFALMRELQTSYNELLSGKINEELERVNEDPDAVEEEQRAVLMDKDILLTAIAGSHDLHIAKIDQREDEVTTAENAKFQSLLAGIRVDEHQRNRDRIDEIYLYINRNRMELDDLTQEEEAQ